MSEQRIVMFGAGSAATGIADQILAAMVRAGLSRQEARSKLWLIDIGGLIHDGRTDLEEISAPFAQPRGRILDWPVAPSRAITLADVVKHLHPTVLIGTSAQPGAFTQDIVEEMARHVGRPIIFPLSNPTSRCEANPADLLAWTDGRALVATGSPYGDVPPDVTGGGRPRRIGQCNNAYIFPGVGLGVIASAARRVTDEMFMVAADALSDLSPALTDPMAPLFPPLQEVRSISRTVAVTVARLAQQAGLAASTSPEELERRIDAHMWTPRYSKYRRL